MHHWRAAALGIAVAGVMLLAGGIARAHEACDSSGSRYSGGYGVNRYRDVGYGYGSYNSDDRRHDRAHDRLEDRHDSLHDRLDAAHERAHERGFYSERQHERYHDRLEDRHDSGHDRLDRDHERAHDRIYGRYDSRYRY